MKYPFHARLEPSLRRLKASQSGNVAMIVAFTMIPMSIAVGMGVDYTLQKQKQDQLNGIADAAALVALTPTMLASSPSAAALAATTFFNAEAATVPNANAQLSPAISVIDTTVGVTVTRNVTVTWVGASTNTFGNLLGMKTSPLSGTSTAANKAAPNINFYLLVDTSPSMGIVSSAQMATMMAATPNTSAEDGSTGGCAFACHEVNPSTDGWGFSNPNEDNYALARSLNLTLRIDLVNYAIWDMMATAYNTENTYHSKYGMSISSIDNTVGQIYNTPDVGASIQSQMARSNTANAAAQSLVSPLQQLEVYSQNCITKTNCGNPNGNDQNSSLDLGLSTLNTINTGTYSTSTGPGYKMYIPGQGTNTPAKGNTKADTPQEVLLIITDGMVDEYYNGSRKYAAINTIVDNCTAIKSHNIRIAFLYLYYSPLTGDDWYMNHGPATVQPNIEPAAQACASSPQLYKKVTNDADIDAALTSLFQAAVSTAHLTH